MSYGSALGAPGARATAGVVTNFFAFVTSCLELVGFLVACVGRDRTSDGGDGLIIITLLSFSGFLLPHFALFLCTRNFLLLLLFARGSVRGFFLTRTAGLCTGLWSLLPGVVGLR